MIRTHPKSHYLIQALVRSRESLPGSEMPKTLTEQISPLTLQLTSSETFFLSRFSQPPQGNPAVIFVSLRSFLPRLPALQAFRGGQGRPNLKPSLLPCSLNCLLLLPPFSTQTCLSGSGCQHCSLLGGQGWWRVEEGKEKLYSSNPAHF